MIGTAALPVAPLSSVAVSEAVHLPAGYALLALGEAWGPTVVPSPKANRYDTIVPSGSLEPAAVAVTASGSLPVIGVTLRTAVGGSLAVSTVMAVVAEPDRALAAVNVTV